MKKILVWLSGWVDSAVSAYLLKKQWYDVTAWFMVNYLWLEWEFCSIKEDIEVAKEVASFLDIPFFTFDFRKEYSEKVLNYLYEWYKNGITPNPDIMCNSEVKFKVFLDEAIEAWFDMIATGHYANIEKDNKWIYHLKKWMDEGKDQSYFLAGLNQYQLSKAMFPIWDLEKSKVREIALEVWLPNAKRKDSQWICFVWKVDIAKFLEKKIDPKPGRIVDTLGNMLWNHNWVYYYTIWQRKGLDIWGLKEPVFVIRKDIKKNELIVWTDSDLELYWKELVMKSINILTSPPTPLLQERGEEVGFKAKTKIRYRQKDQDCIVEKLENWRYRVKFKEEQRAIASGQICAIYDEDELIMSGVID